MVPSKAPCCALHGPLVSVPRGHSWECSKTTTSQIACQLGRARKTTERAGDGAFGLAFTRNRKSTSNS